jgi:hypothetical protein
MCYVTNKPEEEQHFGKVYQHTSPGVGRFIVITGYKEVDGTLYREAYDLGRQRWHAALVGLLFRSVSTRRAWEADEGDGRV